MRRLRAQEGMTIIEVLVAMVVLTVGILSLMGAFDGARKLTLTAERRESIAHLAQRELERLQSVPYKNLAMATAPAHESIPASDTTSEQKEAFIHEHPDYYVDYASPASCTEVEGGGCFAANAEKLEEKEEPLVVSKGGKCPTTITTESECGVASASPTGVECSEVNPFGACEWTDGRLKGDIYDFITYHQDPACKVECEKSYKRITVVVTLTVPSGRVPAPVHVSTMIPNPLASRENPLSAATKCTNNITKVEESCTQALSKGTARSWFLHDVEAEAVEKSSLEVAEAKVEAEEVGEVKGHNTHLTVGPAPAKPDFMDNTPETRTTLHDYSVDQDPSGFTYGSLEHGGRMLVKDPVGCGSEAEVLAKELSAKQTEGEMWVTAPIAPAYTLNGAGALTIYTQTLGGYSSSTAMLCVGVYDVPEKIENLLSTAETTPKLIGFASYTPSPTSPWPTKMSALEFVFGLSFIKEDKTIPEKHRLGFRVWAPTESISIAYDTALQSSVLQLNTE